MIIPCFSLLASLFTIQFSFLCILVNPFLWKDIYIYIFLRFGPFDKHEAPSTITHLYQRPISLHVCDCVIWQNSDRRCEVSDHPAGQRINSWLSFKSLSFSKQTLSASPSLVSVSFELKLLFKHYHNTMLPQPWMGAGRSGWSDDEEKLAKELSNS